jgi:TIR domain-containing protein/pentapeptide repeat protein
MDDMAVQELVTLLNEQGVDVFNKWRGENPSRSIDLSGADFAGRDLSRANFSNANLRGVDFFEADLGSASFRNADLTEARLEATSLNYTNFIESKLTKADMVGATFYLSNLKNASLRGTYLAEANLRDVWVEGAEFSECQMNYTLLGYMDLSKARGLEKVEHLGPSIVGVETIYRSGGNIPEAFLRGVGFPEDFIVYLRSLAGRAVDFYSCFISYSSLDEEFAERLHADLISKGVRCWFAPEDLKIGSRLRPTFDEAIRVHDKLMVLLSEHSVKSPWVEKEVETAFDKERQQRRTVLFPVRLDDAVMKTDQAWASDIRRTRHIGDFRDWKNHATYKKAFDRLLRDLKAEDKANSY